jgi:hypothetical protein
LIRQRWLAHAKKACRALRADTSHSYKRINRVANLRDSHAVKERSLTVELREPSMGKASSGDVTSLLRRWRDGDEGAQAEVYSVLYDELRRQAWRGARVHRATLQTTALVHEVFQRLAAAECPIGRSVRIFGGMGRAQCGGKIDPHERVNVEAWRRSSTPSGRYVEVTGAVESTGRSLARRSAPGANTADHRSADGDAALRRVD